MVVISEAFEQLFLLQFPVVIAFTLQFDVVSLVPAGHVSTQVVCEKYPEAGV